MRGAFNYGLVRKQGKKGTVIFESLKMIEIGDNIKLILGDA